MAVERAAGPSVASFSDCVSPFPEGKATAVGGEPGITKAVLTRIQVPSPQRSWLHGCWLLPPCILLPVRGFSFLENLKARRADLKRLLGCPFQRDLNERAQCLAR